MWIWWIISFIILIACGIFTYRMIVSSYEFLPSEKRYFREFPKMPALQDNPYQQESIKTLKNKVQFVEDNTTFYEIQIAKLQQRLKALEDANLKTADTFVASKPPDDDEDWKELYYEENAMKVQLENELDSTRQMLEEAEKKLKDASENTIGKADLQKEYEAKIQSLDSNEHQVEHLQQQLSASAEREKELEQLLISEITIREKYSVLKSEYDALQIESEKLKKNIEEINKKDEDLEVKLIFIKELEAKLSACEEDKTKLKASLLRIIESK